jgi:hypothetical protein
LSKICGTERNIKQEAISASVETMGKARLDVGDEAYKLHNTKTIAKNGYNLENAD